MNQSRYNLREALSTMTKRQLIDEITTINRTAKPGFLARFDEMDLDEYLRHLRHAQNSRLSGDASRYSKYFASPRPADTTKEPIAMAPRAQVQPAAVREPSQASDYSAVEASVDSKSLPNSQPVFRTAGTLPPAHRTLPSQSTAATWLF